MAISTSSSTLTASSSLQTSVSSTGQVHVTGLSGSGIDVESLVQGLKAANGVAITRLQDQQTKLRNITTSYQTLGTKLSTLQQSISTLNDYTLYASKSADSSNTSALTVSAATTAASASYDVTVVRQSTATRLYGGTGITAGTLDLTAGMNSSGLSTTVIGGSGSITGTLTINGTHNVTYDTSESLNTIISRINNSGSGVTAIYDQFTKGMVLTNSAGAGPVVVTDTAGNLGSALKLTAADSPTTVAGQTAQITIAGLNNGNPIESNDNVFSETETGITGLTLNVTGSSGTSRVSVSPDGTPLTNAFDSFITSYNDTLDYISQQTQATTTTSGSTTTSTPGTLANDPNIQSLKQQMRNILNTRINSLPNGLNYLAGLGIGTVDATGKLSVTDTIKIQTAMKNDPGSVKSLLIDLSSGIMTKFSKFVSAQNASSSGMIHNKEQSLADQVSKLQTSITTKTNAQSDYETRLRASFSAMESAIARSKATINQLIASFSSSSNN
ncbi:MAG: flagellar filament capping protein FliD [Planctomycetota bacterium]